MTDNNDLRKKYTEEESSPFEATRSDVVDIVSWDSKEEPSWAEWGYVLWLEKKVIDSLNTRQDTNSGDLEKIKQWAENNFYSACKNDLLKFINTLPTTKSTEWIAVSEPNPIYQQAIDALGIQSQVSMAQGECGELIAALTQFFVQGKIDRAMVIDEIADVEIMCSQLRCLFSNEEVDKRKAEKLEKLQGILDGSISHPTPHKRLSR